MTDNHDKIVMRDNIQHARSNVDMYFGSSVERGRKLISNNTTIGVREVIDNALDEVIENRPGKGVVDITIDGTNCSFSVRDNGRGLPVGVKHHRNGINITLGTPMSSGNYEDKKIGRTSLNGVGASVTNAISEEFHVESHTSAHTYVMEYRGGYPIDHEGNFFLKPASKGKEVFTMEDIDYEPYTQILDPDNVTGTFVQSKIENKEIIVIDRLEASIVGATKLYAGLTVNVTIKAGPWVDVEKDEVRKYKFDGGFDSLVDELKSTPKKTVQTVKFKSEPSWENHFEVEAHISILTRDEYVSGKKPVRQVFVNKINVESASFEILFQDWATKFAQNNELPLGDLVEYIISYKILTPAFRAQSKHEYSDVKVRWPIYDVLNKVRNRLSTVENVSFIKAYIKSFEKAKESMEEKEVSKKAEKMATSITGFYASVKNKELFICEGFSAAGHVIEQRDTEYQSVLSLKGTPLNIITNEKHIKNNDEIQALIRILGGYKSGFSVEKCTYEKVIITADADLDGRDHIAPLMLMILHKLFPGLIEAGRVFIADTPLYKLKDDTFAYMGDDVPMELVRDRYKGLGSMSASLLRQTAVHPDTRKLIKVELSHEDKARMDEVLNRWFNPAAKYVKTLIHNKFGIDE